MAPRKKPAAKPAAATADTPPAVFDLAALDGLDARQEDGIDVPIFHPTTKAVMLMIKIAGPDSKRARRAERWGIEQVWAAASAGKPLDEAGQDSLEIEVLARTVISWEFIPGNTFDGSTAFSVARAADLFRRQTFVRRPVSLAAVDRARFMPASPDA